MGSGDFQFDDAELREFSEHIGTWPATAMERGRAALERSMRLTLNTIKTQRLTGQDVMPRSGNLRRSGSSGATIEGNTLVGTITFRAVYAHALEFGADIRPGPGKKFLTRPLTAAMTGDSSVNRVGIRQFPDVIFKRIKTAFVDPQSGAEVPEGALVAFQQVREGQKKRGSSLDIFARKDARFFKKEHTGYGNVSYDPLDDRIKTGEIIPLFWLIRHAHIKPRHFVGNQLRADKTRITADVIVAMQRSLKVKAT